jgi:hypothetical protein
MPDALTIAGILLVAGPALGTLCLFYPPFFRVWTVEREEHLALVAAHGFAWTMANVGFATATVLTAGGLAVFAGSVGDDGGPRAVLTGAAVAYVIAGTLWCVVLGARNRVTPALARMVAVGSPTEPAETLLGNAIGGMFEAFMVITEGALIAIGVTLALDGGIAAPVAWVATLIAVLALAGTVRSGATIPAVIYLPTLLVGIALLAGWA